MMLAKIISGGQTGVDRAALDAALEMGVPCGGWCPKGRRAEDGVVPDRYPLTETDSTSYPVRTEMNVRDSDGTLILTRGRPDRGTALTMGLARRFKKPFHVVDFETEADPARVAAWIIENEIKTLNVAGPRESSCEGIGHEARGFLEQVWACLKLRGR